MRPRVLTVAARDFRRVVARRSRVAAPELALPTRCIDDKAVA